MTPKREAKIKAMTHEYLLKCQEYCGDRLSDPSFFEGDSLQRNALRVETMRDMSPRCALKPPEHWSEGAKDRGVLWIFSLRGSASVFGHCELCDCPQRDFFIKTAPHKEIREQYRDHEAQFTGDPQ